MGVTTRSMKRRSSGKPDSPSQSLTRLTSETHPGMRSRVHFEDGNLQTQKKPRVRHPKPISVSTMRRKTSREIKSYNLTWTTKPRRSKHSTAQPLTWDDLRQSSVLWETRSLIRKFSQDDCQNSNQSRIDSEDLAEKVMEDEDNYSEEETAPFPAVVLSNGETWIPPRDRFAKLGGNLSLFQEQERRIWHERALQGLDPSESMEKAAASNERVKNAVEKLEELSGNPRAYWPL